MRSSEISRFLLGLIYPGICPVCNRIIPSRTADICPQCIGRLSFVGNSHCMKCGKPVDDEEEYCSDCLKKHHDYDEGRAVLIYDEVASSSIYRFKYNGKREYALFYARIMHERLGRKIKSWNVDAIIPVPIHPSKLKKRGYNQAQLIAGNLSKRLGIRMNCDIITRKRATGVQKNLSAKGRQNNLKKAFNVSQNVVKLDSVLIVDDIYTTGATVDAMARCLKGAGVKNVYFAALCIGRGN